MSGENVCSYFQSGVVSADYAIVVLWMLFVLLSFLELIISLI